MTYSFHSNVVLINLHFFFKYFIDVKVSRHKSDERNREKTKINLKYIP